MIITRRDFLGGLILAPFAIVRAESLMRIKPVYGPEAAIDDLFQLMRGAVSIPQGSINPQGSIYMNIALRRRTALFASMKLTWEQAGAAAMNKAFMAHPANAVWTRQSLPRSRGIIR